MMILSKVKTLIEYAKFGVMQSIIYNKEPTLYELCFPKSITSYNNNSTSRRLKNGKVYDKDMFTEVLNLFNDKIGYKPSFISVIEEENSIETMKDTILFAKELGTTCKLNKALSYGRQETYYPRYRFIAQSY